MSKTALLLIAAPLALAACGGGAPKATITADPVAYVKHAAHTTAALPSEHMTMTGTASAGGTSLTMSGSGDFSQTDHASSISMTMASAGRTIRMDGVESGATLYMTSPLFAGQLPSGKKWIKLDLEKAYASRGIDFSSVMSESPSQSLQRLDGAGTVKSLGSETIDGVETTHFQASNIDISKIPQGKKLEALGHYKVGPIDTWIGNKDGYVYREKMSYSYVVSGRTLEFELTIDLSNFGEAVHVTVPPASEVVDMTNAAIKGLGG